MTETREYSVAKRPLRNLPAERRAEIGLEVLQAYASGEEVADLAPEYGVSDVTLYALLIRDHEDAWKQAQISRAIAKKAKADADLDSLRTQLKSSKQQDEEGLRTETPHDALSLARCAQQIRLAEVQAKRAEWELERVYRRVYGQEKDASDSSRIAININLSHRDDAKVAQVIDVQGTSTPIATDEQSVGAAPEK